MRWLRLGALTALGAVAGLFYALVVNEQCGPLEGAVGACRRAPVAIDVLRSAAVGAAIGAVLLGVRALPRSWRGWEDWDDWDDWNDGRPDD